MGKRSPRRGSLAYWHRARAGRLVPRVRSWLRSGSGLAGFAGYKAGMQSILMVDDSTAPTSGQEIVVPVTVLETPPIFVYSVVAYKKTPLGLKAAAQVNAANAPKQFKRSLTPAKKSKLSIDKLDASFDEFRVLACTQPWKAGLGKKTPEIFELALNGTPGEQLEYAKSVLGKEVRAADALKSGEYVDAIAVTTGRGWQGVVQRMGVSLNPRKASGTRRHGGTIGGERQAKVMYTIPRAGQHGFHRRTDVNKRVLAVGDAPAVSFAKQFKEYGALKTDFVVVRGSVPGPAKRFVTLRKALQQFGAVKQPTLVSRS